jgi:hypothetical protein
MAPPNLRNNLLAWVNVTCELLWVGWAHTAGRQPNGIALSRTETYAITLRAASCRQIGQIAWGMPLVSLGLQDGTVLLVKVNVLDEVFTVIDE